MAKPAEKNRTYSRLTAQDVERLLHPAETDAVRTNVAEKVAQNYISAVFSERESEVAEQIFRLLIRDTEVKVRAALANQLKESPTVPRDVMLTLARDVEEVSLPVLRYSEVLNDSDIVELINTTREVSRHVAIAQRKRVTETVSSALVATHAPEVAEKVLTNPGASIREADLQELIDFHSNDDTVMEAMAARDRLPPTVVEKLVSVVSEKLAEGLKEKYAAAGAAVHEESERTREIATLSMLKQRRVSDAEMEKLINQLQAFKRLTPSLILSALCGGHMPFFEMSLAKLAGVPLSNARRLIVDDGDLGFQAIYNKSGLPEGLFSAVRLLANVVHSMEEEGVTPESEAYSNRLVEELLAYAENDHVENLSYIIALVRRG